MCVWSWVLCGVIVLFTVSLLVARLRAAEGLNTAERCELCLARAFLFFNCAHAFFWQDAEEDLSNLLLAWYYAGFYTAQYRFGRPPK